MTDEQLSEKISKSATKLVMRKYPFIMSGDFIGTFQPEYTYRTGFKFQEDAKITGIKTILLVNPEIFFDINKSNLCHWYFFHIYFNNSLKVFCT